MSDRRISSPHALSQTIVGADVKRKRIEFVHAATGEAQFEASRSSQSVGDRYLSIVLKDGAFLPKNKSDELEDSDKGQISTLDRTTLSAQTACDICNLPLPITENEVTTMASNPHD